VRYLVALNPFSIFSEYLFSPLLILFDNHIR